MQHDELGKRVIGKCREMCPESEVQFRETHNLLTVFERLSPKTTLGDKSKCVKEFRRSAAGEKLNDELHLRPAPILLQTTTYLLKEVACLSEYPFRTVYDFVFDRLRSVRQDLSIQEIQFHEPLIACNILEKCIRFYLYARFIITSRAIRSIDLHIHRTQTQHCLQTLIGIYRTQLSEDSKSETLQNAPEFISVYLLSNLGSNSVLLEVLMNFRYHVRSTYPLDISLTMALSYIHNNMVRIYKCIKKLIADSQTTIILSLTDAMGECHTKVLDVLSHSHSSKTLTFSCDHLRSWLLVKNTNDVKTLCEAHGFHVNSDCQVRIFKPDFLKVPKHTACLSLISTGNENKLLQM